MSEDDGGRAQRLARAASALDTRRRASAVREAQLRQAAERARAREAEMIELMAALAGETRILAAAHRRLAALQIEYETLTRERERLAISMRRDGMIARGARKAAGRLAEAAARAQERADLDALLEAAAGRAGSEG
jgi:hypothetical protein